MGSTQVECSLVLKLGTATQEKSRQEPYLFSSKYFISATGRKPFQKPRGQNGTWNTQKLFRLPLASWWEGLVLHSHFLVPWNLFSALCQPQNCQQEGLAPTYNS